MGRKRGPRIERICQTCDRTFAVKPSRIKQGDVKFCSWACYQKARTARRKTKPRDADYFCVGCGARISSRGTKCSSCMALHRNARKKKGEVKYRDPEWLRRKHWDEYKTYAEMAGEAGCSITTIQIYMNKLNIPRRSCSESLRARVENSDLVYVSEDWLNQKYVVEGLTIEEMAELANRSSSCIQVWLDRRGIPRRIQGPDEKPYLDSDWLQEKYWDEKLSIAEIADAVGVDDSVIYKIMKRRGIPFRQMSEAVELSYKKNPQLLAQRTEHFRQLTRSPEFKASLQRWFQTPEGRQHLEQGAERLSRLNADPEFQARRLKGMRKCPNSNERAVMDALDKSDIDYVFQYRLGSRVYDFFLKEASILIEQDGSYWHSSEEARRIDAEKDALAEANGFMLFRFTDVKSVQQASDLLNEHVIPVLNQKAVADEN